MAFVLYILIDGILRFELRLTGSKPVVLDRYTISHCLGCTTRFELARVLYFPQQGHNLPRQSHIRLAHHVYLFSSGRWESNSLTHGSRPRVLNTLVTSRYLYVGKWYTISSHQLICWCCAQMGCGWCCMFTNVFISLFRFCIIVKFYILQTLI